LIPPLRERKQAEHEFRSAALVKRQRGGAAGLTL